MSGRETPGMVADTMRLIQSALDAGVRMNVTINNRAAGNVPILAQEIARGFLGASPGTG